MQAKELERQRTMDAAKMAIEKQQWMLEQRRQTIEQQHYLALEQQARNEQTTREATERERESHDRNMEAIMADRIGASVFNTLQRTGTQADIAKMNDATRREGQFGGLMGRLAGPILGGGGSVENLLQVGPYANAMMRGDVSTPSPQTGGTATAESPAGTPAPTSRGPSTGTGPKTGPGSVLDLPSWMTKPLPGVQARNDLTAARLQGQLLTNQQKAYAVQIAKTKGKWDAEWAKYRAKNMISVAEKHALDAKYGEQEWEGRIKKLNGEIAAEAALTTERLSNARTANANATIAQSKSDDMKKAGGYTRWYQQLHDIDPGKKNLKDAQTAYQRDQKAYSDMLLRYQMFQKRKHELEEEVNKYAVGEEKDELKYAHSSNALTEIQSSIIALGTQMEQTQKAVEFDRMTKSFYEGVQRHLSEGPNSKVTKAARKQSQQDMKPPPTPGTRVDKPAAGGFPMKADGRPDFSRFSKQQLMDWYRTHR